MAITFVLPYPIICIITKLPESSVLCGNITLFGVVEDHLSPALFDTLLWAQVILHHPKLSDIATQHTRHMLFCVCG